MHPNYMVISHRFRVVIHLLIFTRTRAHSVATSRQAKASGMPDRSIPELLFVFVTPLDSPSSQPIGSGSFDPILVSSPS